MLLSFIIPNNKFEKLIPFFDSNNPSSSDFVNLFLDNHQNYTAGERSD